MSVGYKCYGAAPPDLTGLPREAITLGGSVGTQTTYNPGGGPDRKCTSLSHKIITFYALFFKLHGDYVSGQSGIDRGHYVGGMR